MQADIEARIGWSDEEAAGVETAFELGFDYGGLIPKEAVEIQCPALPCLRDRRMTATSTAGRHTGESTSSARSSLAD